MEGVFMQSIAVVDHFRRMGVMSGNMPHITVGVHRVVSLREIAKVEDISLMPTWYLERMIHNVSLVGDPKLKLYKDCQVEVVRMDPRQLSVGQRFVQRDKCQRLAVEFQKIFAGYYVEASAGDFLPLIIRGKSVQGVAVIAHYMPPIVEDNGSVSCVIDGIHRNYNHMAANKSVLSIVIRGVETPVPFSVHSWKDVKLVDEKPPKDQRFFDLQPHLFRDMKMMGIDG